ncbi:hypothetical protein [Salinibacter sp.]|uniref:hypothetical protein n=1 Tax=Salinibacter sp. TaxID=2065818 RepID=UPI0021E6F2A5|nr:hypothetical protein [Salinibacter sp.]
MLACGGGAAPDDADRHFVGTDPQEAHVPPAARARLRRFEDEAAHCDVFAHNREQ